MCFFLCLQVKSSPTSKLPLIMEKVVKAVADQISKLAPHTPESEQAATEAIAKRKVVKKAELKKGGRDKKIVDAVIEMGKALVKNAKSEVAENKSRPSAQATTQVAPTPAPTRALPTEYVYSAPVVTIADRKEAEKVRGAASAEWAERAEREARKLRAQQAFYDDIMASRKREEEKVMKPLFSSPPPPIAWHLDNMIGNGGQGNRDRDSRAVFWSSSHTSSGPSITAICNDGSPSYSEHRRGTCSGKCGVHTWLNRPFS